MPKKDYTFESNIILGKVACHERKQCIKIISSHNIYLPGSELLKKRNCYLVVVIFCLLLIISADIPQ